MNPHIGYIIGGNIIGKPFMAAFMYDDVVPFHTPPAPRKIKTLSAGIVPVHIVIAVSCRALVLHAKM